MKSFPKITPPVKDIDPTITMNYEKAVIFGECIIPGETKDANYFHYHKSEKPQIEETVKSSFLSSFFSEKSTVLKHHSKKVLKMLGSGRDQKRINNLGIKGLQFINSEKNKSLKDKLVIPYDSLWKAYLDTFIDLVLIYNVVTTLFFLGFEEPNITFFILDEVTRFLFILEIILTFLTERLDESNIEIVNIKLIAWKYVKFRFFFDLLAVLPVRLFGYPKAEYLLRLLVRLFKIPTILDILN